MVLEIGDILSIIKKKAFWGRKMIKDCVNKRLKAELKREKKKNRKKKMRNLLYLLNKILIII
jgi:hypothetical protein